MSETHLNSPVCVLGAGLIGGSLLRDLRALGHPVTGFDPDPATARAAGLATDLPGTLRRCAEENALLVLAAPIPAVPTLLDALRTHAPGCGFTDVCSVKSEVARMVSERGLSERWVGGHPMAGTAEHGWEASREGLFRGAAWALTFDGAAHYGPHWPSLWAEVVHLAEALGARAVPALAAEHDAAVARISHLPHLLADALAVVASRGGGLAYRLAAGSFADGTRVAGAPVALQRALCESNAPAVAAALDEAIELLSGAREALAEAGTGVAPLATAGRNARRAYEQFRNEPLPPLAVRPGEEGWLEALARAAREARPVTVPR